MKVYTIILLYEWNIHKDEIKKIFKDNDLIWNSNKIKKLTNEELLNEYIKFKVDSEFEIKENMDGSSGIYENKNSNILIKIIKINNTDNILIVYKGNETEIYKTLIKKCRNIGCLIIKIVDNEIIFKDRLNVKLINTLDNIQKEKEIKIKNFIEKMKFKISIFSDDFKNRWIKCIKFN